MRLAAFKGRQVASISGAMRAHVLDGKPLGNLERDIAHAFMTGYGLINERSMETLEGLQGDLFLLIVAECLHRDRPITVDDVVKACAAEGIKIRFKAVKK